MRITAAIVLLSLSVALADDPQLPPAGERAKASAAVAEVFGAESSRAKTPVALAAMAGRVRKAAESEKEPAVRWAMLDFARGLTIQAGDTAQLAEVIGELHKDFGSGPLASIESGEMFVKASKASFDILDFLFIAADAAMDRDDYAAAGRIAAGATTMANQLRDASAARYFGFLQKRAAELGKKLAAAKDDADALARFHFFEKQDIKTGSLLLAKARDPRLIEAAAKDAKAADANAASADILAAGDAWWSLTESSPDKYPLQLAARAAYSRIVAELTGLEKAKYELRIRQTDEAIETEESKAGLFLTFVGTWEFESKAGTTQTFAVHRSGRVVFDPPSVERLYLMRQGKFVVLRQRKELSRWTTNGDTLTIDRFTPDGGKSLGSITAKRK
jgi:hypothetical protein